MPLTDEPDTGAALAERLDATASRPALEAAMDELPPTHRQAVQMRVVDELDYPGGRARTCYGLRQPSTLPACS